MSWIDPYNDRDVLRSPYGYQEGVRPTMEMNWQDEFNAPDISAPDLGEMFPSVMKAWRGQYAGRPASAPGTGYDILPEIAELGVGLGKKAANIPIQMYRRAQVAKQIPEMGALFKEMGNPISNIGKMFTDAAEGITDRIPKMGWNTAEVMADEGAARVNPQRLIDKIKGSWNIEVPYLSDGRLPQAFVTTDADNRTLNAMRQAFGGKDEFKPGLNGFSTTARSNGDYLADIVAMRGSAIPKGSGIHEISHAASKRARGYDGIRNSPQHLVDEAQMAVSPGAPQRAMMDISDYYEAISEANPKLVNSLLDNYPSLSPDRMGEEIFARDTARQWANRIENPEPELGKRLEDFVASLTHPKISPSAATPGVSAPLMKSAATRTGAGALDRFYEVFDKRLPRGGYGSGPDGLPVIPEGHNNLPRDWQALWQLRERYRKAGDVLTDRVGKLLSE